MRIEHSQLDQLASQTDAHAAMMCHYAILDACGDGEATTSLEPSPTPYVAAPRADGAL